MSNASADDSLFRGGLGAMPLHRLRRHAEQLATHLSAVASDLDRREAEFASERARRDCELRAARLWANTRIADLRELVEQLQQHATQLRLLSSQVASGQLVMVDRDQQDLNLVACEQQLKAIHLRLAYYQERSVASNPSIETNDDNDDLAKRTATLNFREQSLERDRRALAEAYRETMDIHDSAEQLLQHGNDQKRKQGGDQRNVSTVTTDQQNLRSQTQALEEAEKRLRQVYSQITTERTKTPAVKKITPPSWMQERQELIGEINRLQAALEKSTHNASSQKAA